MVVPVEVALGRGTPRAWRARLRLWFEKSKPGILLVSVVMKWASQWELWILIVVEVRYECKVFELAGWSWRCLAVD
jgi:hypothetical protein